MALKQLPVFFCHECGNPDWLTKPNKIYCSESCRSSAWNRRISGGFRLYELAMRWRIDREKGDMAELTAAADQLAGEERILRARRSKNIEIERAKLPPGTKTVNDNIPGINPSKSRGRSVSLSIAQQEALKDAALFAIAFSEGRIPNDPDKLPSGWPAKKLDDIRNAIITLGGGIQDEEAVAESD